MEKIMVKLPGKDDFFTQEAYKVLRTNLQFCGPDIRVIAFTSCNENEGKSTITLSLGKSMAELGRRVLVIDADMRKSVMAGRNTNAKSPVGLSEVLSGQAKFWDAICETQYEGLSLLFAGKYPPNPVELLSGDFFAGLLREAREYYDCILIDTPPLGQVIDAAVIAPCCDGTVLVLGDGNVRRTQAVDVVEQLKKTGCRLLGVVRNQTKKSKKAYGKQYGYGYKG